MSIHNEKRLAAIIGGCLTTLALSNAPVFAANPCGARNPCATKQTMNTHNPCNPCAGVNPCAAGNPCAAKNPCAEKNPCAARNPCAAKSVTRPANYRPYRGNQAELLALGAKLFNDTRLSTNGMSCASCHKNYGAYQKTFAEPYPHYVTMANAQFKVKAVHADEMVQLCMVSPMAAKPLPWESKELAALSAYVVDQQKGFAKHRGMAAMNPCAAKNPCAAR